MLPKLPPLADVLDLVPDAVCVVDPEGHFLYVSASFERTPGEVLGRLTFDLIHPDDRAETIQQAAQVMAGELQRHFRNRYIHKDGHPSTSSGRRAGTRRTECASRWPAR